MPLHYQSRLLSGWGRYPASRAAVARPERYLEAAQALQESRGSSNHTLIARGGGLAYGDAALNSGGRVVSMSRLNRFLEFDAEHGLLTCEAGVSLGEILGVCMPHGWILAVIPGTARATVGGCLACDVHGKNHHRAGGFSRHVTAVKILLADGEVVTCGPDRKQDLFWATAGGMGLTGIILEATLRLERIETNYVWARHVVARDLEGTFRRLEDAASATYSVAWLDGVAGGPQTGRGVVIMGEHSTVAELPAARRAQPLAPGKQRTRSIPLEAPIALLGRPLARALNEAIYRRFRASGEAPVLVDAWRHFFPLDALRNWNRLFGPAGFVEYQVVLPQQSAFDGIRHMLELVQRVGAASFFTSVKQLGEGSPSYLSFPMPGYVFSFTVGAGDRRMVPLLRQCDELTTTFGGRIYLAKDARTEAGTFARMYARHDEWRNIVRRYDPTGVFGSDMSRRLSLV